MVKRLLIITLIVIFLTTDCVWQPAKAPVPGPTPFPSETPLPTPIPAPTLTPMPLPTPDSGPTPTASPTATPTHTLVLTISVEEVKRKLDSGQNVILVDVRPEAAFDGSHIGAAVSMPLQVLPSRYAEIPQASEVIIYADCT